MLPSSLVGLLKSGLAPLLVTGVLKDLFTWSNRPSGIEDESVDSFLSRRFGSEFARTFGSALVHGIYAADSRTLSVRAAFPTIWEAHLRGGGSVSRSMFNRPRKIHHQSSKFNYELGGIQDFMRKTSVFSFKGGVSDLSSAISDFLQKAPNVELVHNSVLSIRSDDSPNLLVCTRERFKR